MKEVFPSECLVHVPEVLQLREGQQEALQQQRAGIAEVHLGQAGKVQAYSRGFQAEHTSGINIGWEGQRGERLPPRELPMGQDSPLPPWGLPNWPNERSRNAGVSMAPGSVHPHPVLANLSPVA